MKAWVLKRLGGPLELVDLPEPEAEEGEVVLRVEAVGLNFADHLMRLGAYLTRLHPPFIPGMEVVGVVVCGGGGGGVWWWWWVGGWDGG